AADSLKWREVSLTAGTTLVDGKLGINLNAGLDPYALDNANRRIDRFNIDNGGSLFRLTRANLTLNYSFSSTDFSGRNNNNQQGERNGGRSDDLFGADMESNRRNQSQQD